MLPRVLAKLDILKKTTEFCSVYLEVYLGRQKYSNFYLIVYHRENLTRTGGYSHFAREALLCSVMCACSGIVPGLQIISKALKYMRG